MLDLDIPKWSSNIFHQFAYLKAAESDLPQEAQQGPGLSEEIQDTDAAALHKSNTPQKGSDSSSFDPKANKGAFEFAANTGTSNKATSTAEANTGASSQATSMPGANEAISKPAATKGHLTMADAQQAKPKLLVPSFKRRTRALPISTAMTDEDDWAPQRRLSDSPGRVEICPQRGPDTAAEDMIEDEELHSGSCMLVMLSSCNNGSCRSAMLLYAHPGYAVWYCPSHADLSVLC